ncbi:YolD-like family protein [Staphylococcus aureus]
MIPEKYRNVTDYRMIPRQYLNPNIPKGRGSVKWQPFATMPEQYQQLSEYIEDQNKIAKPLLSSEQIEIINHKLINYAQSKALATIYYWNNGYMCSINGIISRIDKNEKFLLLSNEKGNETKRIDFTVICEIE